MTLRHAVALALVGWYLMLPPGKEVKGPFKPDASAPLSQWSIQSSFDAAADCENARKQLQQKIKHEPDGTISDPWSVTLLMATCIATDDSRLAK